MSSPSSMGGIGAADGTRGFGLWISSIVMVIVAGVFVTVRCVHRMMRNILGTEDYLILASLFMSVALTVTEIKAVENGYGARYKTLTSAQATQARKWFYGAQIAYKIVLTLNKMSICQMYYRIFSVSSKSFRNGCYLLQAIIFSSGIAFTLGTVWQCTPIEAFWDITITEAWCFSQTPWWLSFSVLQILLDFALLGLPVKEVTKLNMGKLEKLGLSAVFCTGMFVTFTSIFRATTLASSASDPDPTWGPIPATVWAVVEANSGIVAACLPLLRQLFVQTFGRFVPSSHRTGPKIGYTHGDSQRPDLRIGNSYKNFPSIGHVVSIGRSSRRSGESGTRIVGEDIHVLRDISVTSSKNFDNRRGVPGYCSIGE